MDESSVGALIGIVMSSAVLGFVYAVIRAAASGFVDHNGFIGIPVSYTHLTLPTIAAECRSRW